MNTLTKSLGLLFLVSLLVTSSLYAYAPGIWKIPILKIAGGSALTLISAKVAVSAAKKSFLAIAVRTLLFYFPVFGGLSFFTSAASIGTQAIASVKLAGACGGGWVGMKLIKNGCHNIKDIMYHPVVEPTPKEIRVAP